MYAKIHVFVCATFSRMKHDNQAQHVIILRGVIDYNSKLSLIFLEKTAPFSIHIVAICTRGKQGVVSVE